MQIIQNKKRNKIINKVTNKIDQLSSLIIITPQRMKRMIEDEWGDLECLYKSCQTAMIELLEACLFTDTGINK